MSERYPEQQSNKAWRGSGAPDTPPVEVDQYRRLIPVQPSRSEREGFRTDEEETQSPWWRRRLVVGTGAAAVAGTVFIATLLNLNNSSESSPSAALPTTEAPAAPGQLQPPSIETSSAASQIVPLSLFESPQYESLDDGGKAFIATYDRMTLEEFSKKPYEDRVRYGMFVIDVHRPYVEDLLKKSPSGYKTPGDLSRDDVTGDEILEDYREKVATMAVIITQDGNPNVVSRERYEKALKLLPSTYGQRSFHYDRVPYGEWEEKLATLQRLDQIQPDLTGARSTNETSLVSGNRGDPKKIINLDSPYDTLDAQVEAQRKTYTNARGETVVNWTMEKYANGRAATPLNEKQLRDYEKAYGYTSTLTIPSTATS